jgi:integrase
MNINTLRKILVTLNQIMAYAVKHGYINYNPVRDAERPRGQGKIKTDDIRVLSPSEINKFINCVKNEKYRVFFMLAAMSGARQGELIGLKWSDIDWINNQIHIKRTYNNGGWYIPKSKASIRKIDLGSAMMVELKKWLLACPSNKLNLVFPNAAGNVIDNSTMLRGQFLPALKSAGLPRIRFHDLRHTKASIMIEQGENIKYIQTQLGHSSPSVTLDVYAHLIKPTNKEAAERFENLIFQENGSNSVAK